MSKKRPKRIFRERRRPEPESPESKAFRRHMEGEEPLRWLRDFAAAAAAGGSDAEFVRRVEQHATLHPDRPNEEALSRCACPLGKVRFGDIEVYVVGPLGTCDDNTEFDRAVCAAGLKRFVRRSMDSDRIGRSSSVPPEAAAFAAPGDWLIVMEVSPGVHCKGSVRIGWSREPSEAAR